MHYVEAGSGDALLLVHGGHGSWTHWIAIVESARHWLQFDRAPFFNTLLAEFVA